MSCLLCGGPARKVLDLGPQPISHRFLKAKGEEARFPLAAGRCERCGLAQLVEGAPEPELAPRFDWVRYIEPEAHLDEAARLLAALPGVAGGAACGATYKDESLLARLEKLGIRRAQDGEACALVLARHVVEHPREPRAYLERLARRVAPGGWLMVEVPDCERGFAAGDVTTIWEEHTLYFTERTLPAALSACGWRVETLKRYPYPMEDCLMACARPGKAAAVEGGAGRELEILADMLPSEKRRWAREIDDARAGRKVALLGAGHRGVAFASYLELADRLDFVVDDDPHKSGLLLPGAQKPILPGSALAQAALCLVSANPDSGPAIAARHAGFTAAGGRFVSIYPQGARA